MARTRFVKPMTDRLPLSDGDWIDVKRHINIGELRAIARASDGGPQMDALKAQMLGYIVGWSFRDDDGPVKFTEAALDDLDPQTYYEINLVLNSHIEKQQTETAARKNEHATDGETRS